MATKEKSKGWVAPDGFTKTIELSSGKAKARVTHGFDTVDAKLMALGRWLRDKDGKIRTEKVRVPATSLRIKLTDDTVIKARSCCKPPDVFSVNLGVQLALHRLAKTAEFKSLSKDDRRLLIEGMREALAESLRPARFRKVKKAAPKTKTEAPA